MPMVGYKAPGPGGFSSRETSALEVLKATTTPKGRCVEKLTSSMYME